MRKFIVCLLALMSAFIIATTGCSCSKGIPLTFSCDFSGQTNDPSSYKEQAVYKVEYLSNYEDILKKDASLDKYVTYEFSTGTYTTSLETFDLSILSKNQIQSDIVEDLNENATTIYKYSTNFQIEATYHIAGEDVTCLDSITTETYFCSYRLSYAPIYSKTITNYSLLAIAEGEAILTPLSSICETFYNKAEYKTIQSIYPPQQAGNDNFLLSQEENTQEYEYRTAIDNTQLLFATRNIAVEEEQMYNLPTISYQYNKPKTLTLSNVNYSTTQTTINYNGSELTDSFTLRNYSISLSNGTNTGMPHFAKVMKEKTQSIGQVLMLSYVQPLTCYGGMYCMGALQFTLTSFVNA